MVREAVIGLLDAGSGGGEAAELQSAEDYAEQSKELVSFDILHLESTLYLLMCTSSIAQCDPLPGVV